MTDRGDYRQDVRRQTPIVGALSADRINWWNSSSRWVDQQRAAGGGKSRGDKLFSAGLGLNRILVQNNSGSNVAQFGILGISAPIILPTDSQNAFNEQIAFACITPATPTHIGKFVVAIEPIATGSVGWGVVAGVVPAYVDFVSSTDTTADVTNGDVTQLTSSAGSGAAQILWTPGGTGMQLCTVRIGSVGTSTSFLAYITAAVQGSGDVAQWTYTFQEVIKTSPGYGGWSVKSGGRTGTAYNQLENANGSAGMMGMGIDTSGLPDYIQVVPFPLGLFPVRIWTTPITPSGSGSGSGGSGSGGSSTEYWFEFPNSLDTQCGNV